MTEPMVAAQDDGEREVHPDTCVGPRVLNDWNPNTEGFHVEPDRDEEGE